MRGEWLRKPSAEMSVVFVHGILSSGEKCWLHGNGTYWPELLSREPGLDSLGIYIYTYQTGFGSGSYSLGNVVDDLKERVFTLDGVADSQKIVFVCHSMGGIVVRRFIVEREHDFLDRNIEIGLYLVASPSLGSEYANWLEPIARFVGHEQAKALQFSQSNHWLNDLDKTFMNQMGSNRLSINGKELLEDKSVFLKSLIHKQVVESNSGFRYFPEPFKVPGSDHFSIAKPENNSSDQHRLLKAFLIKMQPALDAAIQKQDTEDSHQQKEDFTTIQSATGKTDSHITHQHHLPDQPDNKFIEFIKGQIVDELKSPDLNLFREVLKQELDKSLEKLNLSAITDNQVYLIVDGLIAVLKSGKTDVPVITSVLTNAALHCLDKRRGKYYQVTLNKHTQIKEAIEQMLGWMVLASVDDSYAQSISSVPDYSGVYFELPVETSAGVEIIVSRRYQRQAKFQTDGSNAKGQNHLFASSEQFSWETTETVDRLKCMLWNQVFPDETKTINLNKKETDRLNAELEIRRADEWAGEHHLIAIECEKIMADTKHEEVYRQLLKELSNLTLVQFGVSDSKQVFYAPEHNLMSAINRFLNKINKILES